MNHLKLKKYIIVVIVLVQITSQLFFSPGFTSTNSDEISGYWLGRIVNSVTKTEYEIALLITKDMAKQHIAVIDITDLVGSARHNLNFSVTGNNLRLEDNNFEIQGNPKQHSLLHHKFDDVTISNLFAKEIGVTVIDGKDTLNGTLTRQDNDAGSDNVSNSNTNSLNLSKTMDIITKNNEFKTNNEANHKSNKIFKIQISKEDIINQIDNATQIGSIFDQNKFPKALTNCLWYKIPNQLAGVIHFSKVSYYRAGNTTPFFTGNQTQNIKLGYIKDKTGQIWDKKEYPSSLYQNDFDNDVNNIIKTYSEDYYFSFISSNQSTIIINLLSLTIKVNTSTNVIVDKFKSNDIQTIHYIDDSHIEFIANRTVYDLNDKIIDSYKSICIGTKSAPFVETIDRSTRENFIQYLKDNNLNDLIPD